MVLWARLQDGLNPRGSAHDAGRFTIWSQQFTTRFPRYRRTPASARNLCVSLRLGIARGRVLHKDKDAPLVGLLTEIKGVSSNGIF